MDIFKLFYNHDQRLDELAERNAPANQEASLEDFMTPDPTYSKFYLTGTQFPDERFGINRLGKYDEILEHLDDVFKAKAIYTASQSFELLSSAIVATKIGDAVIISDQRNENLNINALAVNEESNVGHFKKELADILEDDHRVLYKEQAKDGFDLHLFSQDNIYPLLFGPLQQLVDNSFRFFSINSKRMRSERHFYFETWTLDKPPHGAEEVFGDTVLRSKET